MLMSLLMFGRADKRLCNCRIQAYSVSQCHVHTTRTGNE
jgi:hypothetical protein